MKKADFEFSKYCGMSALSPELRQVALKDLAIAKSPERKLKKTLQCKKCKESFPREELTDYKTPGGHINHYCPKCYISHQRFLDGWGRKA